MIVAYLSDKARHRYLFAMAPLALSLTGFGILLTVQNRRNVQYGALCLVAMGTFSSMPVMICWFNMNLGGHHRRSVGVAWQIGFGNIGGIIATYSFLQSDAPRYRKGYTISITFTCLSAVTASLYLLACWRQNRARDRLARLDPSSSSQVTAGEGGGGQAILTESEKAELGDLNPDYRYLL